MEKITIKLDDALFEKMNERKTKKGCKTLSQCARELIDLALKVEAAAELQEDENIDNSLNPLLLDILKTSLISSLETRFLVRFLVEKKTDIDPQIMMDFMQQAKEKAVGFVTDFLQNSQNASAGGN